MIGPESGKPYLNPWLAGAVLGLLVTAAFAAGKWFGASSAFVDLARILEGKTAGKNTWMGWEVAGLAVGGFVGSRLAGRFGYRFTRGPRVSPVARGFLAALGGVLVMVGSRFASGCTSGLALSGGARLSVGAFVFMGGMFAAGFGAAAVARRVWS